MDDKIKTIRSEAEFHSWFIKNYRKLGYEGIVRKDIGKFPDFIMHRNNKEIKVELETDLSNFLAHKHDINKVDEILCVRNNLPNTKFKKPVIEVKELDYFPRLARISFTIEEYTDKLLNEFLKKSKFRNKSHLIEEALIEFIKKNGNNKSK